MKAFKFLLIASLLFTLGFAQVGFAQTGDGGTTDPVQGQEVAVTGISLDKTNLELTVGATGYLTATITPADATNKEVKWSTSDSNVATVLPPENAGDLTVPIKAQAEGEAIITATTVDGSFMAASVVKVTKAAAERELDELKISDKSLTLKVGETKQLTLTAEYEDDTEEDVTATAEWVSIPKAVVEVNGGLVTAKAAGKGMVLASFGGEFVKVEVKVVNESQLKKLEVTPGSVKLAVGGTKQMQLKAVYENGNSEDVTAKAVWKSSDESQATVSEAGLITAVAKGNPIVTASFGGKSVPVKVEIKAAAQKEIHKLEIVTDKGKKGKLELKQGETATVKVIAIYKDKTEEDVTASVSYKITGGKNVISVENSTITANGKGTAVLFAQYQKKNAKLTVQVKK